MDSPARLSSLDLASGHTLSTKRCFSLFFLGVLLLSPSAWGFDPFGGSNPLNPFVSHTNDLEDPDGDGFPNAWEAHYGTDPQSATSYPDPSHYAIVDASATGWGVGSPSSPFTTLQEAIDQAPSQYGIILVEEGTYPDPFSLFGKSLLIRSRRGAAHTILTQSGFSIDHSSAVVLDGFTLQDFDPSQPDSPLWIGSSQGAILNCIFQSITTPHILTLWLQPDIQFRNCLFRNNTPTRSLLFTFEFSTLTFLNCTFIDNTSTFYEGLIGSTLNLRNTLFWGNGSPSFVSSFPGTQLTIEDSCIEGGYPGTGNQSSDPLVLSTGFLEPSSPYIGSGTPLADNPIDLSRRLRTTNDWGVFDHQDSDNDGIYDSWEVLYYGTLDQVGTPLLQGTWQQVGIDIDGEAAGDWSGRDQSISLSADGQTVAIGSHKNDGRGIDSGHVRIYQWDGSAWQQLGGDIDGEAAKNWSGWSLSLSADGQTVAIGARLNDDGGNDAGHVRIYQWDSGTWEQRGADIYGEATGDCSGWSLSLSADGQSVAIGAHFNDGGGDEAGHVRIYTLSAD